MKREEAIQWLETVEVLGFDEKADRIQEALEMAIEVLKEQERKTAVWIYVHPIQGDDDGGYLCSQCRIGGYSKTKYCPHCGFKMEGVE